MKKLHLLILLYSITLISQSLFSCSNPTLSLQTTASFTDSADYFAYSPDGTEVALGFGSGDPRIRIINSTTGTEIGVLDNGSSFGSVAYSPDGLYIAAVNIFSQEVQIYDRATLDPIPFVSIPNSLIGTSSFLAKISYSSNGQYIACITPDGLTISKVATPIANSAVLYSFLNNGFFSPVNTPLSLSFNPDSTTLAVVSENTIQGDYRFVIINLSNGTYTLYFFADQPRYIQYSPDGKYLSVLSSTSDLRTYAITDLINPILDVNIVASGFSYSSDSRYIAYQRDDVDEIRLVDALNPNSIIATIGNNGGQVIDFNPNGRQIGQVRSSSPSFIWRGYSVNNRADVQVSPLFTANCNSNTSVMLTTSVTNPNTLTWTLPDATTSTDNPLNAIQSGLYTLSVTDASNYCNGLTRLVYVNSEPIITLQPTSQTVNEGALVQFEVAATPLTTTIQWQESIDGITFTDIAGQTNPTYSFVAVASDSGKQYRALLTNPLFPDCAVLSNVATVTITGTITPAGPVTLCFGGSVVLTAQTGAVAPTFQWFNSVDNVSFAPIVGETMQTYEATTSAFYRVSINGVNTQSVQVIINTEIPAIITPAGSVDIIQGGSIQLTANSGTGLTYAWYRDGVFINNAQSIIASDAGSYTVTITDSLGCTSTSAPTIVNVIPTAEIVVQVTPSIQEVELGGSATFTATVITGTVDSFTWTGPNNFTATGSTITLTNVTREMYGIYYLTAAQTGGNQTTVAVSLGQKSAFNVAITTPTLMNILGSDVVLTAVTNGQEGPFVYSWTGPNGFSFISGEPTLALDFFSREDVGSYTVTVVDANRNTDTASITLSGVAVTSTSGSVTQDKNTNRITSSINYTVEVIGGSGTYAYTWLGANLYPQISQVGVLNSGNYMSLVSGQGPFIKLLGNPINNEMQFSINTSNSQFVSSNTSTMQVTLTQDPVSIINGIATLRSFALLFSIFIVDANGNNTIIALPFVQKLDQGDLSAITGKYSGALRSKHMRAATPLPSYSNLFNGGYAIGSKDQKLLACMQSIACMVASAIVLAVVSGGTVFGLPASAAPSYITLGSSVLLVQTSTGAGLIAAAVAGSSTFFASLGLSLNINDFTSNTSQATTVQGDQTINARRV